MNVACRNVKLGLVLLREAKRGPDSPWQQWIESLPHEVATLLHWSDKQVQELQLDSTSTEREFRDQVIPYAELRKQMKELLGYFAPMTVLAWRNSSYSRLKQISISCYTMQNCSDDESCLLGTQHPAIQVIDHMHMWCSTQG